MELGKQIKKHRADLGLSQESLAERIFVSRQTISNWENDKSYPDVNSLLLLSEVFSVSIDTLIKGDLEEMKEQIKTEDRAQFEKLSGIFAVLTFAMVLTPIPLLQFCGTVGMILWVVLAAVTMYVAVQVEKKKKQFNIQTYREILAFSEGRSLNEIERAKEEGKRPYQTIFLAVAAGAIALVVSALMMAVFGWFS